MSPAHNTLTHFCFLKVILAAAALLSLSRMFAAHEQLEALLGRGPLVRAEARTGRWPGRSEASPAPRARCPPRLARAH